MLKCQTKYKKSRPPYPYQLKKNYIFKIIISFFVNKKNTFFLKGAGALKILLFKQLPLLLCAPNWIYVLYETDILLLIVVM